MIIDWVRVGLQDAAMRTKRTLAGAGLAVVLLTGAKGCGSTDSTSGSADAPNPLDTPATATCQQWLDATQGQRDAASQRFVVAESLRHLGGIRAYIRS